ncbi:MAG: hypothetical protein IKV36_04800 [Clostridia bacterium]|nr:hypothetical protein [Clostridia bacterium]
MTAFWIIVGVAAGVAAILLVGTYICFLLAFYSKKRVPSDEYTIPQGEIYEPYRDVMIGWMKEARSMPHKEYSTVSFDGLTLFGKYYEYKKGAPIELMMHGYRGEGERDLCGGVQRAFSLGRSALVIDQRGCGKSDGNVITFGINESRDCLTWVDFIINNIDKEAKIILTGISMGAATVIMAAGRGTPTNVIGVLADCGYTSAKEIIKKVIRDMKLPADLLYPLVKAAARLWGGFDLEEISPIDALQKTELPICFFHGEDDAFVPCEMSVRNHDSYGGKKMILTVKGAGHGLCYMLAPNEYLQTFADFGNMIGLPTEIKK